MSLVSNKISRVCNYEEQTFSQMKDLFEVLNESEQYLAMNPEKLIRIFQRVCDYWRSILAELNQLRKEVVFSFCVDANLKRTLEECIEENKMILSVVEVLDDTLRQAYYEYEVSGMSGNLANIAPLCLWQNGYCKQYPIVKKVNMQLVEKLNLLQSKILCIEEITSS